MSRMKIAVSLSTAARLTMLATLAAIQTDEDTELRDLFMTGWMGSAGQPKTILMYLLRSPPRGKQGA